MSVPPRLRRVWLADVLGCDPGRLLAEPDPPMTTAEQRRFEDGLARLAAGEPLARVRGWQCFWGLRFGLNHATLDPRGDSEILIARALAELPEDRPLRLLDLGTGSGCLLLAVLHARPLATGLGVDRSADAVQQASANAADLGLGERAEFRLSDWWSHVTGRFDLVLCNPPYVGEGERHLMDRAALDFDPASALFSGQDGLDDFRRLLPPMADHLSSGGFALIEHGFRQQAAVAALAEAVGLRVADRLGDWGGNDRALLLRAKKRLETEK